MPSKRIDMGDIFTEEGIAKLKKGQVLTFNYEGSPASYKITRIERHTDPPHVWAKPVTLYHPDEVTITDKPVDKPKK